MIPRNLATAHKYFRNLPWGETDVEQNTGDYDNPYKFNGKELDEESGLYYYGARYYNPRLSIWYGVDPLAEKMPGCSSYAYASDNPVRFINPERKHPIINITNKIISEKLYFGNISISIGTENITKCYKIKKQPLTTITGCKSGCKISNSLIIIRNCRPTGIRTPDD